MDSKFEKHDVECSRSDFIIEQPTPDHITEVTAVDIAACMETLRSSIFNSLNHPV